MTTNEFQPLPNDLDDVLGHASIKVKVTADDDVEGHGATIKRIDGADDDVDGHGAVRVKVTADDDVDGHGAIRVKVAGDDDVDGHAAKIKI